MSTDREDKGRNRGRCAIALAAHLLTAAALTAQPAAGGSAPLDSPDRAGGGGRREVLLAVTRVGVPSTAFDATRNVFIWLPDGAAGTGIRYPVLIFPDAEEKGQFRAALANIQFLIDRQLIPPIMVVGVPYLANRTHELTPPASGPTAQAYPQAGGADQTMQFIADELLPWIDARYPTLPMRLLAGHSFGGLFALYTMVTRPDVFRVVIAMSPALGWNDGTLSPELAARLAGDTLHRRTLFLTSGGLEPPIDGPTTDFAARLTTLLDSLHTNHLTFERRRYPRDIHSMTPVPSLVDGLRMAFDPILVPVDSVLDQLSGRHPQDSAEIRAAVRALESRYAANAAALGIPAPFPEAALDQLGAYSLEAKQVPLAVTLLRENCDRYPHSSNAHESLGEGLLAAGDTAAAVHEFRAAVRIAQGALDPNGPILVQAHERAVLSAANAQLDALPSEVAGASR